jgi:K+-transporting ATPase c subunit
VERISKARQFDNSEREKLLKIINELTEGPQFLFFGEQRINVLSLNIELNKIR